VTYSSNETRKVSVKSLSLASAYTVDISMFSFVLKWSLRLGRY